MLDYQGVCQQTGSGTRRNGDRTSPTSPIVQTYSNQEELLSRIFEAAIGINKHNMFFGEQEAPSI